MTDQQLPSWVEFRDSHYASDNCEHRPDEKGVKAEFRDTLPNKDAKIWLEFTCHKCKFLLVSKVADFDLITFSAGDVRDYEEGTDYQIKDREDRENHMADLDYEWDDGANDYYSEQWEASGRSAGCLACVHGESTYQHGDFSHVGCAFDGRRKKKQ